MAKNTSKRTPEEDALYQQLEAAKARVKRAKESATGALAALRAQLEGQAPASDQEVLLHARVYQDAFAEHLRVSAEEVILADRYRQMRQRQ